MNTALMVLCLAGAGTVGQPEDTVFKAPRIEVKTRTHKDKTYSYLLYNRVYLGQQYHKSDTEPDLPRLPTTYFHDKSPIGLVLKDAKSFPKKAEPPVMVLGMDVGTLAAYAQAGQTFHFTERVPALVKLSLPDKGGKRYFTFIQDAIDRGAKVKLFEGEPREMLEKHSKDKFYKVIVVETYKLPVIEVHKELLTKEALQLLMSKLTDDGIVCYHTSNRYYQMAPIIASAANELKLACIVGKDSRDGIEPHRFSSEWVMVARDQKHLANLKNDPNKRDGIEGTFWHEPVLTNISSGRLMTVKVNKEFLWTDNGEQSFRGLYNSDPEIDKLHDVRRDVEDFLNDSVGITYERTRYVSRPVSDLIRAWSKASAEKLNRNSPLTAKKTQEKKK